MKKLDQNQKNGYNCVSNISGFSDWLFYIKQSCSR